MSRSLAKGISASLAVCLAALTLGAGFAISWQVHGILTGMERSRYGVIADALRAAGTDGLSGRGGLADLPEMQAMIGRVAAQDGQIMEIAVFDAQGSILYDTDPGAIGAPDGKRWLSEMSPDRHTVTDRDKDVYVEGGDIRDASGALAGGMVVRYAPPPSPGLASAIPLVWIITILGGAMGLGIAGCWAVTGRLRERYAALSREVGMTGTLRDEFADLTLDPDAGRALAARFRQARSEAEQALTQALGAIDDLDPVI